MKRKSKFNYKGHKASGITLIALVITIIVLLILAGVTIATLTGDNGLLTKAGQAKEAASESEIGEQIQLCYLEYQMEKSENEPLEDFMRRKLETTYGTGNVTTSKMGINCKIDIAQSKKIYILKYDGNIKEVPRIEKMAVTKVYGKLDDNNDKILHLSGVKLEGFEEIQKTYYGNYSIGGSYSGIEKVIIDEPIAPTYIVFRGCAELVEIENIEKFHTENMTSFNSMFYGCTNLEKLDVSNFDTSNVTNMGCIFWNCQKLKNIDLSNFDTSKMTTMESMFQQTYFEELDLSSFNTEGVISMAAMFRYSGNLKAINLNSFNTCNVTSIGSMFHGCNKLENLNLSNFNTSKVTSMVSMFDGCSSLTYLNVSSFDTSNITSMRFLFINCSKLTSLDLNNFDTSKVTDMYAAFYGCGKLENMDLSNMDTKLVTNYKYIFMGCGALKNVNLTGKFRISDGEVNCYGFFDSIPKDKGIKIKSTQDTREKIINAGGDSVRITIDNFEIVE